MFPIDYLWAPFFLHYYPGHEIDLGANTEATLRPAEHWTGGLCAIKRQLLLQ